jgi:hypothetical protein
MPKLAIPLNDTRLKALEGEPLHRIGNKPAA